MPVKPENKKRYPANWKKEIRPQILQRAGNRCENCGVWNHLWGWRDHLGEFHEVKKGPLLDAGYAIPPFELATNRGRTIKVIQIVLTIAHLDHEPENCDGMENGGPVLPVEQSNLRAWCQRCHLWYDREHHAITAAATRRCKNTTEMF